MTRQLLINSVSLAVLFMCLYIFGGYVLYLIDKKFSGKSSFLVFLVPVYNMIPMCRCAGVSSWHVLGLMLFPVSIYSTVCIWGGIAQKLGKNYWLYGIAMLFFGFPALVMSFDRSKPDADIDDAQVDNTTAPYAVSEENRRTNGRKSIMDMLDMLKRKKRKNRMNSDGASTEVRMSDEVSRDPVTSTLNDGEQIESETTHKLPGMEEPMVLDPAVPKRRGLSPVMMGLIAVIILASAGGWFFSSFKSNLKFSMNKKATGTSFKAPISGVGGIKFSEKTETDIMVKCQGKEGEERSKCLSEGVINTTQAAETVDTATSAVASPTALPPVTPASGADKSPSSLSAPQPVNQQKNQPAAPPPTPPTQISPAPQATPTPVVKTASETVKTAPSPVKAPAAPVPVTVSQPPASRNAPNVVTPPVKERAVPVPIQLALKDDTPFKDRFERRYVDRLKEKKAKEAPSAPTGPGNIRVAGAVNIKDIVGDGKSLAPNVSPTMAIPGLVDGMGAPVPLTTLYGVMISGNRKTALTSSGEVQIGGKIDGEIVVDITNDGVKLKSGRLIQISSK